MLSIIICSRTQSISPDFSENIKNTVGCEYELVVIDNSENAYSIFEAYNLGIERSTGNYLCFVHDDILFHTMGWGLIVFDIFEQNKKLGLLGVAGAKAKTKMPSAWWNCLESDKLLYLKQHLRNGTIEDWNEGFRDKNLKKVVAIDGVLMISRRDNRFRFQEPFEGFHGYDLNISFEYIKLGYEVMVSNLIFVEHFSLGTINEAWLDATYKIHNLYKTILPLSIANNEMNRKLEVANGIRFINKCLEYKKNKQAISIWSTLFCVHPISKYHYIFWKRIIKSKLC